VRHASLALLLALGTPAAVLEAQARDTTVRLAENAVVDVTWRTGRLLVRGTDGRTGTVRGGGRDYQLRSSGVGIVLTGREGDRRGDDRTLELEVPRGVRLVVNTVSANVDVRDVRGDVEFRTTSGDLVAEGLGGRVIAESISGDLEVGGTISTMRVVTVSGDIRARGVRGDVDVRTTSGDVRLTTERSPRLQVQSISGDVQIGGVLHDEARVQVNTHSGDVALRLPAGARGRLELSTIRGELDAGGPLTLLPGEVSSTRRGRNSRRYEFNGGGAMQLDISTFNGNVRIVRENRS
jgi:DUF4097 and DUF4098 domain-containing protein YvlB